MENLFKKYVNTDVFTVKYAKGTSDMRGKEFHTYHEIIYFMGGEGKFISDNIHIDLRPDIIILIPKANYHQLLITGGEEEYHRCVIHFDDIPLLKPLISQTLGNIYVIDADLHIKYLFKKVISLTDSAADNTTKDNIVFSVITLLLDEILHSPMSYDNDENMKTISRKCIDIINVNLCGSISVSQISNKLNISKSALSHIFKKEMNISIYKYILEKRLILARGKILKGCNATRAALECGFNDYSGFYKQYKKMFGTAPSENSLKNRLK